MTRRQRVTWALALLVAIGLCCAAVGYALVRPLERLPDPTAATSPEEVVRTFLDAGNARDRSTMRAIVAEGEERALVPGYGDILSRDNMIVDDVEIGAASPMSGDGTMAEGWELAVRVPVEFHLIQSDGSFAQDDRTTWGYLLVRHSDDEPWQIIDNGVG